MQTTCSKGCGSACRQRKVQELVLGGRGSRQEKRDVVRLEGVRGDNQTCRPLACLRCRQSSGLDMQPVKGAGQQAGKKEWV